MGRHDQSLTTMGRQEECKVVGWRVCEVRLSRRLSSPFSRPRVEPAKRGGVPKIIRSPSDSGGAARDELKIAPKSSKRAQPAHTVTHTGTLHASARPISHTVTHTGTCRALARPVAQYEIRSPRRPGTSTRCALIGFLLVLPVGAVRVAILDTQFQFCTGHVNFVGMHVGMANACVITYPS